MGMLVMPAWRGTLVVPAESEWIIKRNAADPTSGSLRIFCLINTKISCSLPGFAFTSLQKCNRNTVYSKVTNSFLQEQTGPPSNCESLAFCSLCQFHREGHLMGKSCLRVADLFVVH